MENLTCGSCLKSKPQGPGHPWYVVCQDCIKRIAELEAELAGKDAQLFRYSQGQSDYERKNSDLESELEQRGADYYSLQAAYEVTKKALEKAEAELVKARLLSKCCQENFARAEKAEAEVERLRHLEDNSSTPNHPPEPSLAHGTHRSAAGRKEGVGLDGEREGGSGGPLDGRAVHRGEGRRYLAGGLQLPGVNPSGDRSLLSQKPRENDDDDDSSECFFCRAGLAQPHGPGCPAARKERDG